MRNLAAWLVAGLLGATIVMACGGHQLSARRPPASPPATPSAISRHHHHLVVVRFSPLPSPSPAPSAVPVPTLPPTAPPPRQAHVTITDAGIQEQTIHLSAGDVVLVITNGGPSSHGLRLSDPAADPVAVSPVVPPGQTVSFEISALPAGDYTITDSLLDPVTAPALAEVIAS